MQANYYDTVYLPRKQAQLGAQFDGRDLTDQFKPYLGSVVRIKVRMHYGEELTGTVGVTSGWKPVFLLMRRRSDLCSSITLMADDTIVAVKVGRTYHPAKGA